MKTLVEEKIIMGSENGTGAESSFVTFCKIAQQEVDAEGVCWGYG